MGTIPVYGIISVLLIYLSGVFAQLCPNMECMNGGICEQVNSGNTCPGMGGTQVSPPCCNCANTGYQGMYCEIQMVSQQCTSTTCLNGGVCNSNGACDCSATEYYGGRCEFRKALVGFAESTVTKNENQDRASVGIHRTLYDGQSFDTTVNIVFRTDLFKASHQATLNLDITNVETSEEFRNTDTSRRADFDLVNDNIVEGDEYFQLELSIAQGSETRAMIDNSRRTAIVKIQGGDGSQPEACNTQGNSCNTDETCNSDGSCSNCEIPYTSATCTVIPNQPLTITCSPDVSAFSTNGLPVQVTFNLPTVSGGTSLYATSCKPPPDSQFAVGNNDVTCQVTDQDPTIMTRECTFKVVVLGPTGCNSSPCQNAGICVTDGPTGYRCSCVNSWSGDMCLRDECMSGNIICQNGGSCQTDPNTGAFTTCEPCNQGFSGTNCEIETMATSAPGSGGGQNGNNNNNNNNNNPQQGLSTSTLIAIGGGVGGIVLIIIVIIIVIMLMKMRARRKSSGGSQTRQHHRRDNTYADNVALQQRKPNRPRPKTAPRPAKGNKGNNTTKPNKTRKNETRQPPRAKTVPGKGVHRRAPTVYEKSERKIGTEFPRRNLKLHEHLGSGAFANVVRGTAIGIVKRRVSTVVAVKMLKEMATDSDKSDFMKELQVYNMLEPHPNIIVMLGCCTDKEPFYLIMEYAPHGNLQNYLRDIRNAPDSPYNNVESDRRDFLTPSEILNFGSQIATGMKYLESKQCIHRDLATRNVLLGDGLVCKLSDFGLARDISEQSAYEMQSKGRVPVRWMALESLLENSYTSKSDVWSFGITLWELVTLGSHPYPAMSSKRVIQDLKKGYRLPKPEHCSEEIYTLMRECWMEKPVNRPSFDQLSKKLERMLEDANGYLTMTNFTTASYVYLDPDNPDGSSIESGDFNSPYSAGIV